VSRSITLGRSTYRRLKVEGRDKKREY